MTVPETTAHSISRVTIEDHATTVPDLPSVKSNDFEQMMAEIEQINKQFRFNLSIANLMALQG